MQQTSQSLGITGFALLQMCCKYVALVAETVVKAVADILHLLQKLLQVVASSIYCKLQQPATGNLLSFSLFLQQKLRNPCNTIRNTYLFTNMLYLYICNSLCNSFSLISLQIAIYICFLFSHFSPFFVRSYTHFRFLCGKF